MSYYRRCSQASRKGRMFDDLLHEARQWVRFRSCSGGRRKAARSGGGAEAALSYYRRCSQASRKGRMFDDLLHEARQWVRFRSCSGGRRKAARSRQGSLL
ncbi:hypothetical protein F3I54_19790 [Pantoea sp. VH_18]|nr:hypothetical protein F3I54_19790 [Pantoea sp. VH_18]